MKKFMCSELMGYSTEHYHNNTGKEFKLTYGQHSHV